MYIYIHLFISISFLVVFLLFILLLPRLEIAKDRHIGKDGHWIWPVDNLHCLYKLYILGTDYQFERSPCFQKKISCNIKF